MHETAHAAPAAESAYAAGRRAERSRSTASGGSIVISVALADYFVVSLALCTAWWLRFETSLAKIGVPAPAGSVFSDYTGHIVLGGAFMIIALFNFRAYDYGKLFSAPLELGVVFRSAMLWLVAFLGLSLILKIQPHISRIYCVVAAISIVVLLSSWRLILTRHIMPVVGRTLRRQTLLMGWTPDAEQIVTATAHGSVREFEIGGLLLSPNEVDMTLQLPGGLEVLGEYGSLRNVLKRGTFNSVLVADLDLDREHLARVAELCEQEMVDFEIIPSCFPSLVSGLSLKRTCGVPVLGVTRLPLHSALNTFVKRGVDIVGALVGLVVSAPLLLIFGYLVRRESPGPVIYKQRRVGLNGHEFDIYKLRSMRLDAEANARPGWTVKNDPRCLRIGVRMRAWNIDELPQFWNVLKGEMSLVGPRPERPKLIENFKKEVPHYNARHGVKPGITGWAQVNGLRGDTDLGERVRHDLHYIENWNLVFDVFILLRTLVSRKGAC